jgi:hypothetical protein
MSLFDVLPEPQPKPIEPALVEDHPRRQTAVTATYQGLCVCAAELRVERYDVGEYRLLNQDGVVDAQEVATGRPPSVVGVMHACGRGRVRLAKVGR